MRISDWSSDVCSSDLHLLEEVAAVAQVGQRVAGGELVDLLVVVRLHAGVADELEDAFADRDVVAVGQHGLGDRGVVDAGGVGRAEIEDAVLVAVAPDLAVLARYALVGNAQVGFLRTPDQHARGVRSEEHTVWNECGSTCKSRWSP